MKTLFHAWMLKKLPRILNTQFLMDTDAIWQKTRRKLRKHMICKIEIYTEEPSPCPRLLITTSEIPEHTKEHLSPKIEPFPIRWLQRNRIGSSVGPR